ncbi:MAG: bifunctional DNase/RNase [Candidatus Aldehydirespiratoraceae bacterium]|jgi:bifunctional DNase/RNase
MALAEHAGAETGTITSVIPVELVGVRVEVPANTPMVLLREQEGRHRLLPIYIGSPEASSIHYALEGIEPPRPFTHDLFLTAIDELGATLDKIVVTEMRERTFYAEVHLTSADGTKVISARPSDAIALAVRCGAPLFAGDELLEEHGQEPPEEPEEDAAEIIDEFKDFLDEVNPEDFG